MGFTLRPYQQQAVDATIKHFRKSNDAACIVLPTGSGKSLVIAQLANLAKQRILVLTHVKELCQQNHEKFELTGQKAGIYSAGLGKKQTNHQVTFASVQSLAPNLNDFDDFFSLVIVDECHRISNNQDSQYHQVMAFLTKRNPQLKLLGLTATPYRLGLGWIYQYHYRGFSRQENETPFKFCIFEQPLRRMIKDGYLTPAKVINAAIESYDFSQLSSTSDKELNQLINKNQRVTKAIIDQVVDVSREKLGVMIFAATVEHAQEILSYLPQEQSQLIIGDTDNKLRDEIITKFKQKQIKFIVNVSVLTTGFDAPHVDFIAILRPTQSVSLFQQIVGRGLRLSPDKKECLVIDYAGNDYDLFKPELGNVNKESKSEPVLVPCPQCNFQNTFAGITDADGDIVEHFGRRCTFTEIDNHNQVIQCDYRFVYKECPYCNAQNDIAARTCENCHERLIDPDDLLRKALNLKNNKVIRVEGLTVSIIDKNIKVIYHDEQGVELSEIYYLENKEQLALFNQRFGKRLIPAKDFKSAKEIKAVEQQLKSPDFVIAKKVDKRYWKVTERIFDYEGKFRKANEM